jgi:hypothetical protein
MLWESKIVIKKWGEIEKKEKRRLSLCWVASVNRSVLNLSKTFRVLNFV